MKIGIIGFGRFGQLTAKMLKASHEVKVFDKLDKSKQAKDIGVKLTTLDNVCKQKFIILAVPISQINRVLEQIKNRITKGSIVMDTCSVKEYPVKLMQQILPKDVELIASHPMFGPDSAKYGLKGLQMIFSPLMVKKENFNKIKKIFRSLGLQIIEMTPEEHDKQSAVSLALVHFIGRSLEKMKIEPQSITSMGFERLLKVCETVTNDTWQLFEDMQNYNRFTKPLRKKFIKIAQDIDKKLKIL